MQQSETNTENKVPIAEFEGYAECPLFSEVCKITLDKDGLTVTGLFNQLPVQYGELLSFSATDYRLQVNTVGGTIVFSRMGQELEWLKNKLQDAFNDAVTTAFLIQGEMLLECGCEYTAQEKENTHQGEAVIRLYEDCLCILPASENARRLALCWISGMEKTEYQLKLSLATGETYLLSKMGRNLDELQRLLTAKLRSLRENTFNWHKELAPGLSSMQGAASGSLMPLGRAADCGKLKALAPPLWSALETKVKESRMATTWPWFSALSGGTGLILGALPPPEPEDGEDPNTLQKQSLTSASPIQPSEANDDGEEAETAPAPILWLIAPNKARSIAAVELALADNEAAATYLYRVEDSWDEFSERIDQALEAAGFRREIILLSEDKLSSPEHIEKAMLIKRSPAIQMLRRCFLGRAIHSSQERWLRDIEKHSSFAAAIVTEQPVLQKFCSNCGAKLNPGTKFCGQCGSRANQ